ncbi:MAG: dihydropteroate synthase [Thermodesulfobacteriota bacterium]|nr:dihydropteroate synthase [Thermodesulfobacteriota bacterium]
MKSFFFVCRSKVFDLSKRTYIMGILNITPDSFSDGGEFQDPENAVEHALKLQNDGADILDIGGESTRPGAVPVSTEEEKERILPVIKRLTGKLKIPISVDTYKSEVAKAALEAGAEIVNDISALRFDPDMGYVAARFKAPVILMHMKGTPKTMQQTISYDDLTGEIKEFLHNSIKRAEDVGIESDRIVIDPGIGFGKSQDSDNFLLLKELTKFMIFDKPILVGTSRKSFIRKLLGQDKIDEGTGATLVAAILNGANFVRIHDVKKMLPYIKMADKIKYCT